MPTTRLFSLLIGVSLLLAGCASSSSPPPAYVAAADAICTTQLAQLNRLPQPTTPEAAVSYLPQAIAIIRREKSRLAALDPPGPMRSQLQAGLAGQGQLTALLQRVSHQLRSGVVEVGTFSRIQTEGDALKAKINAHFRRAGLARCTA